MIILIIDRLLIFIRRFAIWRGYVSGTGAGIHDYLLHYPYWIGHATFGQASDSSGQNPCFESSRNAGSHLISYRLGAQRL